MWGRYQTTLGDAPKSLSYSSCFPGWNSYRFLRIAMNDFRQNMLALDRSTVGAAGMFSTRRFVRVVLDSELPCHVLSGLCGF